MSDFSFFCDENPLFDFQPGDYVKVSCVDDGCGMDSHTLSKIFELFYAEKNDIGTGLGLSNALMTIKEHSGCIDAASELGKVTEFIIYLPLSTKSGIATKEQEVRNFSFEGKNIVVVDDGKIL